MRKIINKTKKENYLDLFEEWFILIESDDEENLIFKDLVGNLIYYNAKAKTNLISFKLVDESLRIGTKCRNHTFTGAIRKFKKFNIQKKLAN